VSVAGDEVARIAHGVLLLVAFAPGDDDAVLEWMAHKVHSLRIFENADGRMSRSLDDVDGEVLIVSQFTLYGNCRKGARPSFDRSAHPDVARRLYGRFVSCMESEIPGRIRTGCFGAHMNVNIDNDGPVTLILDREARA